MSAATTTKIFIGSIPHSVTEEQLRNEVSQHGRITELFYMQDQVQQNRGWAFVTYSTRDEAIRAINAVDTKLIFPGGDRAVEARFANQKPASLVNTVFQKMNPKAPPSAWQQFFTPEGHPYYYNSITFQTQWERPPELDMMQVGATTVMTVPGMTRNASSTSFGPPGGNLFIFHIPSDWNDIDLVQHFQHFGSILSARIQRDKEGRNRGFGFISFDNPQSATNAIRGMNGFCVSGKFLKVQLKKGEEQFNQQAMQQQTAGCMPMGSGGTAAPFMGIHAPNNPSLRYTPY